MKADKLLTQKEVAERLHMSVENVGKLRAEKKLNAYIFGHRTVRIAESEVWRFMQERRA
jgi:excisionase family DNA binding protein